MNPFASLPTRAGVLVIALALVGGTGCLTMNAIDRVQVQNALRNQEAARRQRIATLTAQAQTGDPAAQTALAEALLSARGPGESDTPRALTALTQAAEQDYGPAQALLGDLLSSDGLHGGLTTPLPKPLQDRARGLTLLQRAATHACIFETVTNRIQPAVRVSQILRDEHRGAEALVWRARGMLYCDEPTPAALMVPITSTRATQAERIDALALLILAGAAQLIANARAAMAPDDVVAAERLAVELRRQLTESEREYPAPPRKDKP